MRWPNQEAPSPREARRLQQEWRRRLRPERDFDEPGSVAGVDISVRDDTAIAAVCVLSWPDLEPLETATAVEPVRFPYVPGLLGFREVPSILTAFEKLHTRPDLLLVDGHGRAHPRRFGVASHLGLALDLPTIGCGKSRFVGEHREPAARRGSCTRLLHEGEVIGSVLRTRDSVSPVFVSIGHRIDLESAVAIVRASTRGFRLPEPIRVAHRTAAVVSLPGR